MKKRIFINGLLLAFALVSGVALADDESGGKSQANASGEAKPDNNMKYNMGYFFGYSFGNMLKQDGHEDVDMDALHKGMQDSLSNQPPNMTRDQQQAVIAVLQTEHKKRVDEEKKAQAEEEQQQSDLAKKNLQSAMDFMRDNAKKPGVKSTASGLQYQVIKEGTGPSPTADDRVKVNYTGTLTDGKVFDSSKDHGPVEFKLKQVIPGWTEGLQLMKEGGTMRLFIPPDLGYGAGGTRGIPPNSVLIFDVDLLKVNPTD